MSKDIVFHDYTEEDYRKLMLRASRVEGEDCFKPLIETDPEEWYRSFDACYVPEPDYSKTVERICLFVVLLTILIFA